MDPFESLRVLDEGTNLCLSGGADGADLQWGMNAGKIGHGVIHWSFAKHRTDAPEQELVRLTQEQLERADDALRRANATLKRRFPTNSDNTNSLLRRNWYQVKETGSLYAVSTFDGVKREWDGGTAWAIQMYMDRFLIDKEDMEKCRVFVWCKKVKLWYTWGGSDWEIMLSRPNTPTGIWTGVGSRELTPIDKVEIRKVMGTYVFDDLQLASFHPIIDEPKPNDIIYVPDQKIPGKGRLDRQGGWVTVRNIFKGEKLRFDTNELMNDDELFWDDIKAIQEELRRKYNLNRAAAKPDYTPENNHLLYWK